MTELKSKLYVNQRSWLNILATLVFLKLVGAIDISWFEVCMPVIMLAASSIIVVFIHNSIADKK